MLTLKVRLEGLVHTKETATEPSLFILILNQKYYLYFLIIFGAFNFHHVPLAIKKFNVKFSQTTPIIFYSVVVLHR